MAMNSWDRAAEIMEQRAAARPRSRPRPATEAARRPRPQGAAVAELGGKLDRLTALVEAFEPSTALVTVPAPAPAARPVEPAPQPEYTAEQLAKLDLAEFRAASAARWAGAFDHVGASAARSVEPAPSHSPEQLAQLTLDGFQAASSAHWAGMFDHLTGGRR